MKILITGGLGFIGSNFIIYILEKYNDLKIINVDAGLLGSNKKNLVTLENNGRYEYVKGDITNMKLMERLISKTDAVINFAAESHVDRSILDPAPFMHSNIMGVYTILDCIRKYKKKLVQISTDEVFGSLKNGSASENYPLNPSSPYAASKASAELLVNSYQNTYDCDTNITRCTNNYGPRQSPEKLIPKVITLAQKNMKIPIYGTGKNVRDWIFVTDHCDAIMRIFLKGKNGRTYNISSGNEIDNLSLVKKILDIMGKSTDLIQLINDRPGHDFRYSLDSKRIRKEIKWKPRHDFENGLEYTIRWYMENKEWLKSISPVIFRDYWKTR